MDHSRIDTTQAFYLAAETRDADVARETLSDFLTRGETGTSRRTLDAPGDSDGEPRDAPKDKAPQTQGLENEADGTRTRNHRIDSQPDDSSSPRKDRDLRDAAESIAAQTVAPGSDTSPRPRPSRPHRRLE
jgi:hypothetical protein